MGSLVDFRVRVTQETHDVLHAVALGGEVDMQTLARELLDAWARRRKREMTVAMRVLEPRGNRAGVERA